jgi:hypothetical protein
VAYPGSDMMTGLCAAIAEVAALAAQPRANAEAGRIAGAAAGNIGGNTIKITIGETGVNAEVGTERGNQIHGCIGACNVSATDNKGGLFVEVVDGGFAQ